MEFKDKYTNIDEQAKPENKDKMVLTLEAYAIGEMLEQVMRQLRRLKWPSR